MAWAIAVVVGGLLGLLLGLNATVASWTSATVDVFRSMPVVAFVPIAILVWGPATKAEVIVGAYAAVWPMLINTAGGIRGIAPRLRDVAATLRLSRLATLVKIVIPATAPAMIVGARLALGTALVVCVVAEMTRAAAGHRQPARTRAGRWSARADVGLRARCGHARTPAQRRTRAHDTVVVSRRLRARGEVHPMRLSSLRGLVPLALLLGLWQLVGDPSSPTAPAPSRWWPAFKDIESGGLLWTALEKTLVLFTQGLMLATLVGVVLGLALGSSRRLSQALNPLFEFFRTTPAAAIVPGAILIFGAKPTTDVGIVVYGSVWPILLNTAAARAALPPLRLEVAHSLRLSWWDRMRKIVLPSLVPAIVVGIRVAAPICFIVTLLVDFLVSTGGIGFMLIQFEESFDAPSAFAMLAFIGIVGFLISLALGALERLALRRWPAASEQ